MRQVYLDVEAHDGTNIRVHAWYGHSDYTNNRTFVHFHGNGENLGLVASGFDVQFPLRWRLANRRTFVGLSVYGNWYFKDAELYWVSM